MNFRFSILCALSVVATSSLLAEGLEGLTPLVYRPGDVQQIQVQGGASGGLEKLSPDDGKKKKPSTSGVASLEPSTEKKGLEKINPLETSTPALAEAGGFQSLAPVIPEGLVRPVLTMPPVAAAPAPAPIDEVLLLELKGLVFVDSENKLNQDGVTGFRGIKTNDLNELQRAEFATLMQRYLGHPVSLQSLNQLNRDVVAFYSRHDRPVVDVVIPEQDITSGVVQLVVVESKVGKVLVQGNKWFSTELIAGQLHLKSGEPIRGEVVRSDLNWINANPFRQVEVVYARGEHPGETDVIVQTKDRFPVRPYVSYDDSGNAQTGDNRWSAGFNWGNVFGLDQQLNYQFTTNNDINKFAAHSLTYSIPLPWRHTLSFFASHADVQADILAPFQLKGESNQFSGRYNIPLYGLDVYTHEFLVGYDFKDTNNNLGFGGTSIYASNVQVSQFVAGYNSNLKDPWGTTSFNALATYSPGDMTAKNKDTSFALARTGATAEYAYAKIGLERVNKLPFDFTWDLRAQYQHAFDNLISSEQFGAGGYATVRGYDEREANGDSGFLVSNEIRTPPVSVLQLLGQKAGDSLQFLGFVDYGGTELHNAVGSTNPNINLLGVGPGVRYNIAPYLSIRFDYGWQMIDSNASLRPSNSRAHLGVIVSY